MQIRTYPASQQELRDTASRGASRNMQNCMFFSPQAARRLPQDINDLVVFGFHRFGFVDRTPCRKSRKHSGQAQHAAGQLAREAKRETTSQLESQKDRATDSLVILARPCARPGSICTSKSKARLPDTWSRRRRVWNN